MDKIHCRKCKKVILTDKQIYKGIGKPKYIDGDYFYKQYEHINCNAKNIDVKRIFTSKQINDLNKIF